MKFSKSFYRTVTKSEAEPDSTLSFEINVTKFLEYRRKDGFTKVAMDS